MFATPRALALSYVDPYVDFTGRIRGYAVVDLRALGLYDWRLSENNVWKVERMLLETPHRSIRTSDRRYKELLSRYRAFRATHPELKPLDYRGRETWTEIPRDFLNAERAEAAESPEDNKIVRLSLRPQRTLRGRR